ncbi:hypothetical protein ACFXG4_42285 [Nocardia sp. NPDC059246]|uniref:hypothetical protein n=1 Tax=unclassified Nocardia TaxID=2637762 RepID=UPI0036838746
MSVGQGTFQCDRQKRADARVQLLNAAQKDMGELDRTQITSIDHWPSHEPTGKKISFMDSPVSKASSRDRRWFLTLSRLPEYLEGGRHFCDS